MAKKTNHQKDEAPLLIRKCGTMSVYYKQLEDDPGYRNRLIKLENRVSARMISNEAMRTTPVMIPVVVHVLFNTDEDNISDAQINSQLAALNADYNATNPDKVKTPGVWTSLVTSANISFELARIGPDGNTATGITRTKTEKQSFGDDNSVKSFSEGGVDAWNTKKYLNIWVCNLGNGLLGYAQFPEGPEKTDGVVILNTAFGTEGTARAPFDKGRSATHEVGHWLNLRHIWGDTHQCEGSDFVEDTPNQQSPNFNKPAFPHLSCTNGPNGDMFMNYMDYVDDDTMVMFTAGQVARMQETLESSRGSLGI